MKEIKTPKLMDPIADRIECVLGLAREALPNQVGIGQRINLGEIIDSVEDFTVNNLGDDSLEMPLTGIALLAHVLAQEGNTDGEIVTELAQKSSYQEVCLGLVKGLREATPDAVRVVGVVSGGCLTSVSASHDNVQFTLVDWDNIKAGDENPLAEFTDEDGEVDFANAGYPFGVW